MQAQEPSATSFLIYDSDCGFCTRSAEWLARDNRIAINPWASLDLSSLGLSLEDVSARAYWVEAGQVSSGGAGAIATALIKRRGWTVAIGQVIKAWPIRLLADRFYRVVARNRHSMPGGTSACRVQW